MYSELLLVLILCTKHINQKKYKKKGAGLQAVTLKGKWGIDKRPDSQQPLRRKCSGM